MFWTSSLTNSTLLALIYIRKCPFLPKFPGALGVVQIILKFILKYSANLLTSKGLKLSVHKYIPLLVEKEPSRDIQWAKAIEVSNSRFKGTILIFSL